MCYSDPAVWQPLGRTGVLLFWVWGCLLPEGRGVNSSWAGWDGSFMMQVALHRLMEMSSGKGKLLLVTFWADLTSVSSKVVDGEWQSALTPTKGRMGESSPLQRPLKVQTLVDFYNNAGCVLSMSGPLHNYYSGSSIWCQGCSSGSNP